MTTPNSLIQLCLRTSGMLGVGQTALDDDVNDVFVILNAMLAQWNRKRYLIYHLVDTACTMTGATSYSVGPMQNFNVARTDAIEAAYARWLPAGDTPVDYPLSVLKAYEDYAAIALKTIPGPASLIFYDATLPYGTIRPYFVPPAGTQELHIITKETLTQFPNLATTINLPPEYENALIWCLSARIRPLFQLPGDPTITALALDALQTIRGANNQIPALRTPSDLLSRGGWSWGWTPAGFPPY